MRGNHFAPHHKSTIFTDDPKAVFEERWLKSHPGCTIVHLTLSNSTGEVTYTKDAEVEAARLLNERPDVCIGTVDDQRRGSLSRRTPGIQL
jgi:hypothetical protein